MSLLFLALSIFAAVNFEVNGFVYTCNELKNNIIPNKKTIDTTFACVVAEVRATYPYTDSPYESYISSTYMVDKNGAKFSFSDLASSSTHCINGVAPWTIQSDFINNINCTFEITTLFTSKMPYINVPGGMGFPIEIVGMDEVTFVAPEGILNIDVSNFKEGNEKYPVEFYTGLGRDESEEMFLILNRSLVQREMLFYYGPVLTLRFARESAYTLSVLPRWLDVVGYGTSAPADIHIFSSGASNNLQSSMDIVNTIQFLDFASVGVTGSIDFDPNVKDQMIFNCSSQNGALTNETKVTESIKDLSLNFNCGYLQVEYIGVLEPAKIGRSSENFHIYIHAEKIVEDLSSTVSTTLSSTTFTTPSTTVTDNISSTVASDDSTTTKTVGTFNILTTFALFILSFIMKN